LILVWLYN